MTKKIELTREELTTILQVATGNVKDFVMNSDKFIDDQLKAINYIQCCTELNTSFKKGDKVIACNKLEGTVVSSETRTMVKVKIKGTTIGINARSLELKSI